jgi:hypothetical protein
VRDRGEVVVVVIYPRERRGKKAKQSLGVFFQEESLERKEEK